MATRIERHQRLPYQPAELLGDGGHKTAFTVDGHPELVMLVHKGLGPDCPLVLDGIQDARKERDDLRRIRRVGLPAAEIFEIGTVEMDGIMHAAHIMRRYVCSDRDTDADVFLSILNKDTYVQAMEMIARFRKLQPFHIEDLQFLFNPDGSFVIADPITVEKENYHDEIAELAQVARGAQYATAVRRGEILHKRSESFWYAANDWTAANQDRDATL